VNKWMRLARRAAEAQLAYYRAMMQLPENRPVEEVAACPFCGSDAIDVKEASSFRWRAAYCGACGAMGPEVRVQTLGEGHKETWEFEGRLAALREWNKRERTKR
jgi:formate dehydrogenase maturation protein FdhE